MPAETFESVTGGPPAVAAITFDVEESIRSDGGSGADVVFQGSLLGFTVVVRRNGTIDVGTAGSPVDVELP